MTGYTVNQLNPEDEKAVGKAFGVEVALLEFNPGKCLLNPSHLRIAQQILDAPVREDDVWLISYPRTGSTWCQEMVWLIGNNLDYEASTKTIQQLRAPILESSTVFFEFYENWQAPASSIDFADTFGKLVENSVEFINNLPSPRYIKTHLTPGLLPTEFHKIKPKLIYIARNPKDMAVSYYHHMRIGHNLQSSFEEFCDLLLRDLAPYGSVWSHYLTYWKMRHDPNVLFFKYEDMKRDLRGSLKKIAHFMGKKYDEDQYEDLCDYLSFQKMNKNKGCNLEHLLTWKYGKEFCSKGEASFIRKGEVGDWKNYMSPELSKRFDDWIEENSKGTGLFFD